MRSEDAALGVKIGALAVEPRPRDPNPNSSGSEGRRWTTTAQSGRMARRVRILWRPALTIAAIVRNWKNSPEPLGPDELLFFVSNQ